MSPFRAILFIALVAYLTSCAGLYQPAARPGNRATTAPPSPKQHAPMSFASITTRSKPQTPQARILPVRATNLSGLPTLREAIAPQTPQTPAISGYWQLLSATAKPASGPAQSKAGTPAVKSPGKLALPELIAYQNPGYTMPQKPYIVWFAPSKPDVAVSEPGAIEQTIFGLNPSAYQVVGRSLYLQQVNLKPMPVQSKVLTYAVYRLPGKSYLRTEYNTQIQVGEYCFPYTVVSTFGQVANP